MKMCRKCHKWMKANDGYLNGHEEIVRQSECSIHPRMSNWRVERTVKTLISWGLNPAGCRITVGSPVAGTARVVISLGDGWVHYRNAKLQLYDYEVPFVDILITEGMIEHRKASGSIFDADPAAVRVTMKGMAWVKELQLRKEAEKKLEEKIAAERALA